MKKTNAFTLAEVLITLGIIGVVAAMTIPTLIANTNSAKFRSQFKKTLSTLNQAGLMAQARYDIDYAATTTVCNTNLTEAAKENPNSDLTFCAILNGTLTGQTLLSEIKSGASTGSTKNPYGTVGGSGTDKDNMKVTFSTALMDKNPDHYIYYTLADGSMIAFNKDARGCELEIGTPMTSDVLKGKKGGTGSDKDDVVLKSVCVGFIDVNGPTLPNKEVNCSDGTTTDFAPETPCTVKADANHMTDIYPVVFHDATVEPATNAAKYVLTTSK